MKTIFVNKSNIKLIIAIVLYIVYVMLFTSCRSVKRDVVRTTEETKVEVVDTTKTTSIVETTENVKEETKTTETDETTITETTYEPINPEKPATITTPSGKIVNLNNAKFTTKETKTKAIKDEVKKVDTGKSSKEELSAQKGITAKINNSKSGEEIHLVKEASYTWIWWIIILIILLILLVRYIWKNWHKIITGNWWI